MNLQNAITSLNDYIEGCFRQPSLQSQHLSGAGAIFLLEEKLRRHFNKKFVLTFSNATTALQAVCHALELRNSEILTSPINWGGSIAPFLSYGNKLRFGAFDSASLNLDAADLSSAFTPKTKTVLSVDLNGVPADSKNIKAFCERHNLPYISDSAQSLGAYRDGKPAGYFADIIVVSFSPGKSCFAGEGGALITNNETVYEKLLWYSQHPSRQKTVFGISNYNEYAPLNGRMNPLSAILLNETFESSLDALKKYQERAFELVLLFHKHGFIEKIQHIPSPECSTFFNLILQFKTSITLDQVSDFFKNRELDFTPVLSTPKPIPLDQSFKSQFKGKYTCTKSLLKQCKNLNFSNWVSLNPSLKT